MLRYVYIQSGGPTRVINKTMYGVWDEAQRYSDVELLGAYYGFRGLIEGDFVNLSRQSYEHMRQVCRSPSAALKSSRVIPTAEECDIILAYFARLGIIAVLVNGGNDSAESIRVLCERASWREQELTGVYLAKTIDCDVRVGHHTPGYPSAARYIVNHVISLNVEIHSMPRIVGVGTMGRDNGSLATVSALAKYYSDDGPHILLVPERPFTPSEFQAEIRRVAQQYGKCLFVFSEGIRNAEVMDAEGKPMRYTAWLAKQQGRELGSDSHGNVKLGGGALGDYLAELSASIGEETKLEVRVETLGYGQRSYIDDVVKLDEDEAYEVGVQGMRYAHAGKNGAVILGAPNECQLVEIEAVAKFARYMPDEFISDDGCATKAFLDFARPLVGPLHYPVRLQHIPISMT